MNLWRSLFVFSFFLIFHLESASPLKVEVFAKGAILMNAETGAVLWEKNAQTPYYPASTTKIITALYALDKKGNALDEPVTASYDALATVQPNIRRAGGAHPPYRLEFGGTHIGLKLGEILPLRALIYGLMLSSGNDAANVIAEHVSGTIPAFMEELNTFVQKKGCLNTVLHTPHGLPHPDHTTTAFDLGLIACDALRNPFFREVVKTAQYPRPQTNKQGEAILHQHNALVKPGGRFFYPKAIGLKTGYTLSGGYSIVAAAEDEQRKLVAVILGCEKLEQRYKDAIALFEAGFNEKKAFRTLFSKGFDLFTQQVEGGKTPLQAYLSQDVVLDYYPSEEPEFKTAVVWTAASCPIAANQKVADLRVLSSKDQVLKSVPLYAAKRVEPTLQYRAHLAWASVKRGFGKKGTWVMCTAGLMILIGTFYYYRPRRKR